MMLTADLPPALLSVLCERLGVLSDENRMKIIQLLRHGERCVCDIVDSLGLPQSLVSHHLSVMRSSGLLRDRRSGKWVYYSINKDNVAELNRIFFEMFDLAGISTEPAQDCDSERCC